jgi:hypothetical protein
LALFVRIDGIIGLVKVAIAGPVCRTISKCASCTHRRGSGPLSDKGGIVHIRGAVITHIAQLLAAKPVPDLMWVALGAAV